MEGLKNGFYWAQKRASKNVVIYAYYRDGSLWAGHERLGGYRIIGKTL